MTLRQLFCRHRHFRRERDAKGHVVLVCEACAYLVPALDRTAKERKVMAKKYPAPPSLRAKGEYHGPHVHRRWR